MQLKFFHDVKCIIFIIEVLLLSPFINNFFGIILTYPTNHDILYHKSHWTCRLIANLLQKWLVITVRSTTSVRKNPRRIYRPATHPIHFAAVSPDKIIAALRGRYFSFTGNAPWKFHEPSERDTGFPVNAAAKQGQELRSEQTAINIHEQWNSLLIFAS